MRLFCWIFCCTLLSSAALAANTTTVQNGPWSAASTWAAGSIPQAGDTVIIETGDSVWLDRSTPELGKLMVIGSLNCISDTVYLQPDTLSDTLVTIAGTFDAAEGWFADTMLARPIVHLVSGSVFRTAAAFPVDSSGIFDSANSPFFALDTGSTFEYYSLSNAVIDISYLMNRVIGHAYRNLTLTGCVASFPSNALAVMGTFHIGFGASIVANTYKSQTVTISGDVVNDNQGPSGAPGAGLPGCGMLSVGDDSWTFDATPKHPGTKDTCHWTGPSQLGNVYIASNTVLSVRFIDDTHCDSLDILTNLMEENAPCGGHLIGRTFSEIVPILDSSNPIDNCSGLGLTITSGTNPYLGYAKVVRTSGYVPPGSNPENLPLLRYYRVTTGAGPQMGTPNRIAMQVHCDEMNGADVSALNFWRSFDDGATWAISGLTSYAAATNIFTWDTSVLASPNDSGSFLWMVSEGYTDTPLPVTLENFSAQRNGASVELSWTTASETDVVGFELDRVSTSDSELLAIYWSDDSLRARSPSGASYNFIDSAAPPGTVRYDLYEITDDGERQWLASQTASVAQSAASYVSDIRYDQGMLSFSVSQALDVSVFIIDALGRVVLTRDVDCESPATSVIPLALMPGMYFVQIACPAGTVTQKIMGGP